MTLTTSFLTFLFGFLAGIIAIASFHRFYYNKNKQDSEPKATKDVGIGKYIGDIDELKRLNEKLKVANTEKTDELTLARKQIDKLKDDLNCEKSKRVILVDSETRRRETAEIHVTNLTDQLKVAQCELEKLKKLSELPDAIVARIKDPDAILSQRINAKRVVQHMFQSDMLSFHDKELIDSCTPTEAGNKLLEVVLQRSLNVFFSFLDALGSARQWDIVLQIVCRDCTSDISHIRKIQNTYVQLIDKLETKEVVIHLRDYGVLQLEEKEEIEQKETPSSKAEALLSTMRRKNSEQFELFLAALRNTSQSHVADLFNCPDGENSPKPYPNRPAHREMNEDPLQTPPSTNCASSVEEVFRCDTIGTRGRLKSSLEPPVPHTVSSPKLFNAHSTTSETAFGVGDSQPYKHFERSYSVRSTRSLGPRISQSQSLAEEYTVTDKSCCARTSTSDFRPEHYPEESTASRSREAQQREKPTGLGASPKVGFPSERGINYGSLKTQSPSVNSVRSIGRSTPLSFRAPNAGSQDKRALSLLPEEQPVNKSTSRMKFGGKSKKNKTTVPDQNATARCKPTPAAENIVNNVSTQKTSPVSTKVTDTVRTPTAVKRNVRLATNDEALGPGYSNETFSSNMHKADSKRRQEQHQGSIRSRNLSVHRSRRDASLETVTRGIGEQKTNGQSPSTISNLSLNRQSQPKFNGKRT